jgi:hypothetical protein
MDFKELIKRKKQSISEKKQSSYEDYLSSHIEKSENEQISKLESRIDSKRIEINKLKNQIQSTQMNLLEAKKDLKTLIVRLDSYSVDKKNGFYFFVSERRTVDIPNRFSEFIEDIKTKSRYGKVVESIISSMKIGEIDIFLGKKVDGVVVPIFLKDIGEDLKNSIIERFTIESDKETIVISEDKITYIGDIFSWNEIVNILLKLGFEQDPNFDILSGSNSY